MCSCQNKVSGMKKRKTTRRRRSSVSGFKMQSPKTLLNIPTAGSAAVTAYGAGKLASNATGNEMAILRSKQGAKILTIGGGLVAFFMPGSGLMAKIIRGVGAGAAAHGAKVWATDEDWAGNAVTADKMDAVAGWCYQNRNLEYGGQSSNGQLAYAGGGRRRV